MKIKSFPDFNLLELLKNSIATINKTLQSTVSIQRKPIEN
ncbi:hypothetical protein LEP1GSC026_0656 [Leptospira interrogans str. 2002000623]|uniref:Uncharacterized protein n=1 Tax=Leptospira interrogans str. UI 12758 TaxID=1049938 RepID=A0A0E2CY00_LEPIR|nr:hypothetical protein LEP1GSC027_2870 [Leptospira interrogans str. 2002000624]EKQ49567.1 hypothetical protein LEP1GSC026_0656 [Leptospira interrogans str. 2002000623]EKR52594.1 hypothetical protein LEP1GSC105_0844 [Leptospira interrogans str. UI 12758]